MNQFDYNRPKTRARIAARRKQARIPAGESAVLPGPQRLLLSWIASGRLFSFIMLFGALAGLWYSTMSAQFVVRDIRVSGAEILATDEIIALSAATGRSIWLVDTDRLTEQLLTNAYVEQAAARVLLPDQLDILIIERRPDVRWQVGGERYLVDSSGLVLGNDTTGAVTNTLVIEDHSGLVIEPGMKIDREALHLSRELALRLPTELGISVASIGWDLQQGITITTNDQQLIIFGSEERLDEKFAVLRTLRDDGTIFTMLDLRPATPYYRQDAAPTP
ncbi:MAG TPA: FtsQ-type POTRA domain-containing protein [Roseiflexaceae bacterium]|nr:FtsQ-type POTRA domain-containing protein [Roseiflexaceae bacterium]